MPFFSIWDYKVPLWSGKTLSWRVFKFLLEVRVPAGSTLCPRVTGSVSPLGEIKAMRDKMGGSGADGSLNKNFSCFFDFWVAAGSENFSLKFWQLQSRPWTVFLKVYWLENAVFEFWLLDSLKHAENCLYQKFFSWASNFLKKIQLKFWFSVIQLSIFWFILFL